MALVAIEEVYWPAPPAITLSPANTSTVIDATGEKVAWIGRVWSAARATKSITKVGFKFGTVTKAGGSAMTVSLQNVDVAVGPPYQPDGTQDQTVAIANADAGFVTGAFYKTAALSASRSVTFGELVAVVLEYDGFGRLGADAVNVHNLSRASAQHVNLGSGIVLLTASWATVNAVPNILLEFTDGSFGTLRSAWPQSNVTSANVNTGTTPDERALEFTVPVPCRVDGAWIIMHAGANADFEIVLYEDTTPVATVAVDYNTVSEASNPRVLEVLFPEVTLAVETTYRLALKPTTANSTGFYYFELDDAAHREAHAGGAAWAYNSRTDGGAWGTADGTQRPWMGLRISALEVGGTAGGAHILGGTVVR